MKFYRTTLFFLLLCFLFPLISNADQLEDANAAITNEDYKKASELLLPLAEENNTEAQTLLGVLYVNGQGVEKDFNKGMALIMKAAKQGFTPARIQAFSLCLDLAKQGDIGAMYNVGYMCLNDWGGDHETNVCLEWLDNAAQYGHEKSAKMLNKIYTKGMFGVTPDEEKATHYMDLMAAYDTGIDGKWEGSVSMGEGVPPMVYSFNFKTDGNKLAGTTAGLGGPKNRIEDGKIDGNNFSFEVESNIGGMIRITQYTGTFYGDMLKLTTKTDYERLPGSRDIQRTTIGGGDSPSMTFIAKRVE